MFPCDGRARRLRSDHADPHASHGCPRSDLEALPSRLARAQGWRHRRADREPLRVRKEHLTPFSFIVRDVIRCGRAADGTVLGASCRGNRRDLHMARCRPRVCSRPILQPGGSRRPISGLRHCGQADVPSWGARNHHGPGDERRQRDGGDPIRQHMPGHVHDSLHGDGSVVYDYRAHAACGQMLTTVPLRPEEARALAFTWGQTSDSGVPVLPFRSYHVKGAILSAKPSPAPSAETRIFVMQGPSGPNLAFTARTDRTSYGPSDSAKVTVILTNIGLDTIVMHFGQPCFVQFLVLDEARHAVYNSSKWWGCVQVLTDEILAPGESRSWVFPWGLTTDA